MLLQKRFLSMEIKTARKVSPEHFFLLYKHPIVYISILLLTDSFVIITDVLRWIFSQVSPRPHVGEILQSTHTEEWIGRVLATHVCNLTCSLSGLSHSVLSVHQNSFLSSSSSTLVIKLFGFAKLMGVKWHLTVILISLITSKVQPHVCQPFGFPVLSIAYLYYWPTYKQLSFLY